MYQAIEAVCRAGQIVPLESVRFEENEHLVIVRMPTLRAVAVDGGVPDWQQFVAVLKDSPHWGGDPVTVQEGMRREWD